MGFWIKYFTLEHVKDFLTKMIDESKKNKILSMAGPVVFFVETASG